eukprot:756529-Hanusia_phi.AAC.1
MLLQHRRHARLVAVSRRLHGCRVVVVVEEGVVSLGVDVVGEGRVGGVVQDGMGGVEEREERAHLLVDRRHLEGVVEGTGVISLGERVSCLSQPRRLAAHRAEEEEGVGVCGTEEEAGGDRSFRLHEPAMQDIRACHPAHGVQQSGRILQVGRRAGPLFYLGEGEEGLRRTDSRPLRVAQHDQRQQQQPSRPSRPAILHGSIPDREPGHIPSWTRSYKREMRG